MVFQQYPPDWILTGDYTIHANTTAIINNLPPDIKKAYAWTTAVIEEGLIAAILLFQIIAAYSQRVPDHLYMRPPPLKATPKDTGLIVNGNFPVMNRHNEKCYLYYDPNQPSGTSNTY